MKSFLFRTIACTTVGCALAASGFAQGKRGRSPRADRPAPAVAGVYTTVSGTISQFNYDRDADVEGFLLSNNTVVHLPPRAALRFASLLHSGDTVQVAGFAQASPIGFQQIEAQSLQDRTSGKSFTMPQPGPAAPYSGAGRIQQLNYGPDGAVNGFFLDNGTLANLPPFNASNPTSIRVGASVSYSGYARRAMSDRTVVDVQTLTINGQPLVLAAAGLGGPGPGGPQRNRAGAPPPPPPGGPNAPAPGPADPRSSMAPPPAGQAPVPPAGRAAEPPPPPPPPTTPPR